MVVCHDGPPLDKYALETLKASKNTSGDVVQWFSVCTTVAEGSGLALSILIGLLTTSSKSSCRASSAEVHIQAYIHAI